MSEPPRELFTAGHSTRSAEELLALLERAGVRCLADVRRFPSSRRHPQHERRALERTLGSARIDYVWLGESLGGRRGETVPASASPNQAWRIAAFRNYADAIYTPAFQAGLGELERLARASPTCVMCAERLWWQCHRRLIADLFVVCGWRVLHLLEPGRGEPHALSEFARVDAAGRLSYPALTS